MYTNKNCENPLNSNTNNMQNMPNNNGVNALNNGTNVQQNQAGMKPLDYPYVPPYLMVTKDPIKGRKILLHIINISMIMSLIALSIAMLKGMVYEILILVFVYAIPVAINYVLIHKMSTARDKTDIIGIGVIALLFSGILPGLIALCTSREKYDKNKLYLMFKENASHTSGKEWKEKH